MDFRASASELSVDYDPFNPAGIERIFTIHVRRLDPRVTAVRLVLANPGAVNRGSALGRNNSVRYDIRWVQDAGRMILVSGAEQPNATNGALIEFSANATGDNVNQNFRLQIPAGQGIVAGNYYQPLELRFVCLAGRDEIDRGTQLGSQVAVDVTVPERIATFVGSAGSQRGRIDFGDIDGSSGNPVRGLTVTAQSTVPYEIRVAQDRGVMKRFDGDDAALPYALKLSGFPVSNQSTVTCSQTPAPSGRNHNVQVELQSRDIQRMPAGKYSDIVTLTFSPRLGLSGGDGCSAGKP
ncbi:hypothetical protein [Novosphingobium sp. PhB165]|uniref:hypothetical protein n=1 Tax=Novosphingobium sp. PhB165 TaxID=2485105 RepID=UPI001A9DCFC0|nr:hypothetical protein [Novosphingobium sp. PhB165]